MLSGKTRYLTLYFKFLFIQLKNLFTKKKQTIKMLIVVT